MKIKSIEYDEELVKNLLVDLHNVEDPIIYTENFIEQIEKRKIAGTQIDYLLLTIMPLDITKIPDHRSRFEIYYPLSGLSDVCVIVDVVGTSRIMVISAFPTRQIGFEDTSSDGTVEMLNIYDKVLDLMSVCLEDGFSYRQTIILEDGFYLDLDRFGCPCGIELIQASRKFIVKPELLYMKRVTGEVVISDELIKVSLVVEVNVGKIGKRVVESEISNNCGVLPGEFSLKITNVDIY